MDITSKLEAQFWWAFTCLTLAGRRNADQFNQETMRRIAGSFATESEVNSILDEAYQHLASVLNMTLASPEQSGRSVGKSDHATYDIFMNCQNGDSIWIETVSGLEAAKSRLMALAVASPGKYVLFNAREGGFIEPFGTPTGEDWVS